MPKNTSIEVSTFLSHDIIERKIYLIRGQKVMFDKDLAALYGVQTRNLNKAVARNLDRFPSDFMFQLNNAEFKNLMFQFGVESIKSVDNVCRCSLISFVIESMLWPIVRVIEDWKPNGFVAINLG